MIKEMTMQDDAKLAVEKTELEDRVEILIRAKSGERCMLHWGLSRRPRSAWRLPPEKYRPPGSREHGEAAVRTPFERGDDESLITLAFDRKTEYRNLVFALYYPDSGRWDNNGGKNYNVSIPSSVEHMSLSEAFRREIKDAETEFEQTFPLGEDGSLSVAVIKNKRQYRIIFMSDAPDPLVLHWGVALQSRYEWKLPPEAVRPGGSAAFDERAVQTPFTFRDGLNRLDLRFGEEEAPLGIPFVLKVRDEDRWLKNGRKNFFIPLAKREDETYPGLSELVEEIIEGETGDHGWTLMHRFNLCHDLLDGVQRNTDGLAMIYVWMRYSAIRQLDWQRRYNTKPRELSHAQDRLTLKIADIYKRAPESRELLRLILSTLGRGGEGQRIRDEILHIMHRHHIKEVAGHFMEEWHQKLHNNTTPDDIVICDAYLEFLRSGGDKEKFYDTLESGGVTKERLENFERPITSEPDFIPHLKDALIHDFENFLRLLRSVHSGTDLETAIDAAGYLMDGELGDAVSFVWEHRETGPSGITRYIERLTDARRILRDRLNGESDSGKIRDMLFLDLGLEAFMRVIIERSIHEKLSGDQLVELTGAVLENVRLARDSEELSECNGDWYHLGDMPRFSKDWSLHAKAVLERLGRTTGAFVDRYYGLFQKKAEYLGRAFQADTWAVTLFTEEVVRGMPAFVLSMLVRHLEPVLRRHAKLGSWQVISPGHAAGRLEVVESLSSVQGKRYDRPSIIVTDRVRGDEEPPEGVTGIITPDSVDLVSHVAVRARNADLLFATCYDGDCFDRLKKLEHQTIRFRVTISGDIEYEKAEEAEAGLSEKEFHYERKPLPEFSGYAVCARDFNEEIVGGKSNNLKRLEGMLPDWIQLPVSAAIPYGVFEKVLGLDMNSAVRARYDEFKSRIEQDVEKTLAAIRDVVLELNAPDDLRSEVESVMAESGFGGRENWDDIWRNIKRVWASKWNERAYFSRKARNMRHEDIFMAVLIQKVVEAEYAFVIHTVNPYTRNSDELYAEAVCGLGETLVGNYPGRAFSFAAGKDNPEPEVVSYPSKSMGLFGGGLIFRSDSNAEDLPGYAGAGLYDSFMLNPPREETLRYREDPLVRDEDFRTKFMTAVAEAGVRVEEAFRSPQDIEGAYSDGKYFVVQSRPQVGLE